MVLEMNLIQEADRTDDFNRQMKKIQDALDKLEGMHQEIKKIGYVSSQKYQLKDACDRLKKMAE